MAGGGSVHGWVAHVAGGMHGWGDCMAGGMHGWQYVWLKRVYMARGKRGWACPPPFGWQAGGAYPTRMLTFLH